MCVCVCVCVSSWTVNVAEVSSSLPYSECCGGLRPLLCVWPHACLLASGGTSSSEGGRTGFYLGLVGRKKTWLSAASSPGRTLSLSRAHRVALASPRGGSPSHNSSQLFRAYREGAWSSPVPRSVVHSSSVRKSLCWTTAAWRQYIL